MKKLTAVLIAVIAVEAAFIIGAQPDKEVALATHITEPTGPITDFQLDVLNYATGVHTDCLGSSLSTKVRIEPIAYISQALVDSGNPSEHFVVGLVLERRTVTSKGQIRWVLEEHYPWSHQNVPPHHGQTRYNTAYGAETFEVDSDVVTGGATSVLASGYYRIRAELFTDVTHVLFTDTCEFTVVP